MQRQTEAALRQHRGGTEACGPSICPSCAQVDPRLPQHGPNIAPGWPQVGPKLGLGPKLVSKFESKWKTHLKTQRCTHTVCLQCIGALALQVQPHGVCNVVWQNVQAMVCYSVWEHWPERCNHIVVYSVLEHSPESAGPRMTPRWPIWVQVCVHPS